MHPLLMGPDFSIKISPIWSVQTEWVQGLQDCTLKLFHESWRSVPRHYYKQNTLGTTKKQGTSLNKMNQCQFILKLIRLRYLGCDFMKNCKRSNSTLITEIAHKIDERRILIQEVKSYETQLFRDANPNLSMQYQKQENSKYGNENIKYST